MYPFVRLIKEAVKFRNATRLGMLDQHVSQHICWPWDLDPWIELNNGRTLTLFDLGRIPYGHRLGLRPVLRRRGWAMAVAGASLRYRRRVHAFDRLTIVTRGLGWDLRFLYIEQSMWRGSECTTHMLLRSAVTSPEGIVPPAKLMQELEAETRSPALPDWVQAWITADAERPWPPLRQDTE